MEAKKLIFRVEYEFEIDGEKHSGIEEEASWFLVDQVGGFWEHGPMQPVRPCSPAYIKLIPRIKIGNEYLTVNEIEARILAIQVKED